MTNDPHSANSTGKGFEGRDIGVSAVLYFLVGLAVLVVVTHFVVKGVYSYLEYRTEANQPPVSPLVTKAPADTRHLPTDYRDYLKQNFPAPQLEIDERNQLDKIRLDEEDTLSTYGYVDQKAGTVRIPIDRAMDLIVLRGLPVRGAGAATAAPTPASENQAAQAKKKGNKK
jgi:hypothetical protein